MIVHHIHHGRLVASDLQLLDMHRAHCLCRKCDKFKPGAADNCPIAEATFKNCVEHGIVTPVYECPEFDRAHEPETYTTLIVTHDGRMWSGPYIEAESAEMARKYLDENGLGYCMVSGKLIDIIDTDDASCDCGCQEKKRAPVCLSHGLPMDEHECLICCLRYKDLTPTMCATDEEGDKVDVCHECYAHEQEMLRRKNEKG